jgi:glyceraldehyde 3-phosphate dehydrogenase
MVKVALNGFGRIGRLFFRRAFGNENLNFVAVNDLGELDNLAYLLKYDTVYGHYEKEVKIGSEGEEKYFLVDEKKIIFLQEKDPLKLPWGKLDIDIVVEATGAFESFEKASLHLKAGAKRVVITAPAKDDDGLLGRTVLIGVNEKEMRNYQVTSNGSCTTNSAHPVITIMEETIGIKKAFLSTVHAYTATQNLVDGPVKGSDWRRGRAAAQNIVPSSTGAAISVTRAVESLKGKFDGIAIRVPTVTGSVAQIIFVASRPTSVKEVNSILKEQSQIPRWKNILKVTEEQIVSSDIIGEPYGAIVDLSFTRVIDGDLVSILSWYDNEMGYCQTLLEHVLRVAELIKTER